MAARAQETRRANAARLRSDYPPGDEDEWLRLATERGLRLPPYGVPCTTAGIRRYLRRLGVSSADYLDWQGAGLNGRDGTRRLTDFITRNPATPLKALVGLMLEALDDGVLVSEATP